MRLALFLLSCVAISPQDFVGFLKIISKYYWNVQIFFVSFSRFENFRISFHLHSGYLKILKTHIFTYIYTHTYIYIQTYVYRDIKKQRHYFAYKGQSSQSYGFSSSHVQMWELDNKKRLSTEEMMPTKCGAGEDSSESLGLQGDQTSIS